jgi:hypothetical protein
MKKQKQITFNNIPLNETQTSTFYDPINYDYNNKVYEPNTNTLYFVNQIQRNELFNIIPDVYITKNKSRIKKYDPCNIHLNNDDEFEIELFNTTTFTLGVKIKIDNEYISTNHLIIEPGQHFFLDRYIDIKRKFKFSTYEVENNNTKVDNAIRFNGNIQIEFYKKNQIEKTEYRNFPVYKKFPDYSGGTNIFYSHSDMCNDTTITSYNSDIKETGKIDIGSLSNQEFTSVDMSFKNNSFQIVNFKLLPMSQKPIEAKDLKPICTNCKHKAKKTDKFCSNCGTKL